MIIIFALLFLIFTYFIAAIPFGLVLSKFVAKKDIREHGSKNIGATNVTRVLGKKLGFLTLILDALKGAAMVILARFLFVNLQYLHLFLVLVSLTAVLAHIYPIYIDFKGGKGVATAIATLFALDPTVGLMVICFWIICFLLFHISSLASLFGIFSSVVLSWCYGAPASQIILCLILSGIIGYRHKENIVRLVNGEEKKMKL
jgi:glycerol-3-phosphate acyltransferase PlsY